MLLKIAWRNIWRHSRRTWITAITIAFGLWVAVTFSALREHTFANLIDTGALMGAGHIAVQPEGYLDAPAHDKTVVGVEALRRLAVERPHVTAASPRISGQAVLAAGGKLRGGQLTAVDPRFESAASNVYVDAIGQGRIFQSSDEHSIVIGKTMSEHLGVGLGKKVVYTTTDKSGELVSGAGRVCGIYETGVPEIDGAIVLVPLDRARDLLGYGPDEATQLIVLLDQQRNVDPVYAALAAQTPPGAVTLTWKQTMASLLGLAAIKQTSQQFFEMFIGLLIAAGVLNTLLMSVLERRREFGIMMALGMSPWRLFGMVVAESLFIGGLGLGLGALATTPWAIYLDVVGLDVTAVWGQKMTVSGVVIDPILRFDLPAGELVGILLALLVLTLLAGLYPAWRAGRDAPVDSIRLV